MCDTKSPDKFFDRRKVPPERQRPPKRWTWLILARSIGAGAALHLKGCRTNSGETNTHKSSPPISQTSPDQDSLQGTPKHRCQSASPHTPTHRRPSAPTTLDKGATRGPKPLPRDQDFPVLSYPVQGPGNYRVDKNDAIPHLVREVVYFPRLSDVRRRGHLRGGGGDGRQRPACQGGSAS